MIDVKTAVKVAADYLSSLVSAYNTRLEEVELTEDGDYWLITLSYDTKPSPLPFELRSYKQLKLNRQTGDVLAMKIRTLQQ